MTTPCSAPPRPKVGIISVHPTARESNDNPYYYYEHAAAAGSRYQLPRRRLAKRDRVVVIIILSCFVFVKIKSKIFIYNNYETFVYSVFLQFPSRTVFFRITHVSADEWEMYTGKANGKFK